MDVRVEEDGQTRIRERYVVSTPLTGRLLRVTHDVGEGALRIPGGDTETGVPVGNTGRAPGDRHIA